MADVSALATNWRQDVKRSKARSARQEELESREATAVATFASLLAAGQSLESDASLHEPIQ